MPTSAQAVESCRREKEHTPPQDGNYISFSFKTSPQSASIITTTCQTQAILLKPWFAEQRMGNSLDLTLRMKPPGCPASSLLIYEESNILLHKDAGSQRNGIGCGEDVHQVNYDAGCNARSVDEHVKDKIAFNSHGERLFVFADLSFCHCKGSHQATRHLNQVRQN